MTNRASQNWPEGTTHDLPNYWDDRKRFWASLEHGFCLHCNDGRLLIDGLCRDCRCERDQIVEAFLADAWEEKDSDSNN